MSEEILPLGWATAEIQDLITPNGVFVDGDWIESKDQDPDGDVRLIQLADIGEGAFLDKSARFLTTAKAAELRCTFLKKDDVLIARMPDPLGRACTFPLEGDERYVTVVDVCIIRTSSDISSPEFLTAAINFLGTRKQMEDLQTGTTRKRISRGNLANVTISLPPLNEQKRIVAKIEELFSELEAGEESLRLARRQLGVYRQSLLKQAFEGKLTAKWRTQNSPKLEWREVSLSSVIDFTSGFAFKSDEYVEVGVPVVRISDVSEVGVSLENSVRITAQPEFEKFRLRKGDILIAMSGATTGKFGELKSDEKCYLNQRVGCFRAKDERRFSQRFLHHLLHGLKRKIGKDAYGGAQPNISGKQINAYTVPSPSPEEQQEIVRLLDEQFEVIERNEREIDGALRKSEALRQSILKKAFTGRLVPQDPSDEPASALLARLGTERKASTATSRYGGKCAVG
ncbi:MAG TPA: restriction endonuclease subunit S [Opitutaceae bacterium]|nr:restriction endonuclease subunit S [Opitutaceae bacterium]